MIQITDKELCTGCTACVSICPRACIVLRRDREGFDYPVANPDLCIGCGACERVCPVLHRPSEVKPATVLAARRSCASENSSSGGMFGLLAEKIIGKGGLVYGAVLGQNLIVEHTDTDSVAGLAPMCGSKYVQSELYSTFSEIKEALESGRKVLFSGTSCQVAGLGAYLGRTWDGLYTVDFACHGVPSPGLWTVYAGEIARRQGETLESVSFRDNSKGWRHYGIAYTFPSGKKFIPRLEDPYIALFLQNMTLRPSCYSCLFRNGRSGSDITLADLWNVEKAVPSFNDENGVSSILVNTEKGQALVAEVMPEIQAVEIAEEDAKAANSGFSEAIPVPERREEFFAGLQSAALKDKYIYMKSFVVRKSLPVRIYRAARRVASRIRRSILK